MRKFNVFVLLVLLAPLLTSCDAIAGIFEAGMWTGLILVVVGAALLFWLGSKLFGRK